MLSNILKEKHEVPPIFMKFTDGGCDQRNNLEKVKCSTICLFKEFDFDMVITGRCAPGQNYTHPCEKVMSILNIGLQNCSTERGLCDENIEKELKKCNSMGAIRKSKDPNVKKSWLQSIYPVQKLIEGRLERLQLKAEPINCTQPVKDYDVSIFQRHLKELFPTLDTAKLQKAYTSKNEKYMQ